MAKKVSLQPCQMAKNRPKSFVFKTNFFLQKYLVNTAKYPLNSFQEINTVFFYQIGTNLRENFFPKNRKKVSLSPCQMAKNGPKSGVMKNPFFLQRYLVNSSIYSLNSLQEVNKVFFYQIGTNLREKMSPQNSQKKVSLQPCQMVKYRPNSSVLKTPFFLQKYSVNPSKYPLNSLQGVNKLLSHQVGTNFGEKIFQKIAKKVSLQPCQMAKNRPKSGVIKTPFFLQQYFVNPSKYHLNSLEGVIRCFCIKLGPIFVN